MVAVPPTQAAKPQGLPPAAAPFLSVPGQSVTYPTGVSHGPYGVAVSPDGKNVYASDYGNDRVIVFTRDLNSGALTVLQPVINGVGGVSGVDGPYLVTISPDGKNVYVTGSVTDTVVSFGRSQVDGTLTFLSKVTRNDPYGFCNPTCPFTLDALDGAYQVVISPDGAYGYVSSILDNKVVVLNRDAASGALMLNPLGGPVQVFSTSAADLSQAYGLALSPDGAHLYLTGYGSDTLLVLARNAADGSLTSVEVHKQGQAGIDGLNGVFRVTTSPDGRNVYTASFDGNAVTAFQREVLTGRLTYLATYKDGDADLDGLGYSSAVAVTPDGARVLTTGFNDDAVTVFDRNPQTGLLVQTQVVTRDASTHLPALDGVRDVAISPDGSSVYATGFNDNQVVAFQASNRVPQIANLLPASAPAGGTAFTLAVEGANFLATSQVRWNGADRPATYVNAARLEVQIDAADIAQAGVASVTVFNPAPGGGVSDAAAFPVIAQNPVPVITSARYVSNSDGSLALVIEGSGFIAGTTVQWNGADRPTTVVNGVRVTISLTAADVLATPVVLTATNPAPGGGVSNALPFDLWKVALPLVRR
jgi:DNA-binding beta-propeller fold protein YncE